MQDDLTRYVLPQVGTQDALTEDSSAGIVLPETYTYPGVLLPDGNVHCSPQTSNGLYPYSYFDTLIQGFRIIPCPAGKLKRGCLTIFPGLGEIEPDPVLRGSNLIHEAEHAKPHYYAIQLTEPDVFSELTATGNCAMLRFTFKHPETYNLLIETEDQDCEYDILPGTLDMRIRSGPAYYIIRLDLPIAEAVNPVDQSTNDGEVRVAKIRVEEFGQVVIMAGVSLAGYQGAGEALEKELAGRSFNTASNQAQEVWNQELTRYSYTGTDPLGRQEFYTSIYHAWLLTGKPPVFK